MNASGFALFRIVNMQPTQSTFTTPFTPQTSFPCSTSIPLIFPRPMLLHQDPWTTPNLVLPVAQPLARQEQLLLAWTVAGWDPERRLQSVTDASWEKEVESITIYLETMHLGVSVVPVPFDLALFPTICLFPGQMSCWAQWSVYQSSECKLTSWYVLSKIWIRCVCRNLFLTMVVDFTSKLLFRFLGGVVVPFD